MAKAGIQLPEKSYFTPDEIAERWACSVSDVFHYMNEGSLRPAVRTPAVSQLFSRKTLISQDEFERAIRRAYERGEKLLSDSSAWYGKDAPFKFENNLPYLYLLAEDVERTVDFNWHMDPPRDGADTLRYSKEGRILFRTHRLETFEGKKLHIVSADDVAREEYFVLDFIEDRPDGRFCHELQWVSERVAITREERDRFECEYGISTESNSDAPGPLYSTPYIEVMVSAIREFFEPRRPNDAKKAEVTDWILDRMGEKGLSRSENIAKTIFTIIKPTDHNPRKRRG